MLSIQTLFVLGLAFGVIVGFAFRRGKMGCASLLVVPVATIAYVSWWQNAHPENLRSTSGLEFVFAPIPPSFGALMGFAAVYLFRNWWSTKDL